MPKPATPAKRRTPATIDQPQTSQRVLLIRPPSSAAESELFDEVGAEESPQDLALASLLTELGENGTRAKVVVEQIINEGGVKKAKWLFECAPAEFSFSEIQSFYGAGDYRVKAYGPTVEGTEQFGILSNKLYSIGAPRKSSAVALAGNQLPGGVQESIGAVLDQMQKMMAQVMGGMNNRAQMLEEMRTMRDLFAPAGTAPVAADPMKGITDGLALMAKLRESMPIGEDGKIDAGSAVLMKGLETFQSLLANIGNKNGAPPPLLLPPAQPGGQPQQPAASGAGTETSEEKEQEMLQRAMFAGYLTLGINAARNDSDVASYADIVFDNAPEEILEMLETNPAWFEELCKMNAGAKDFRPWFEKLRAAVLQIIAESDAPAEAPKADAPAGEAPKTV